MATSGFQLEIDAARAYEHSVARIMEPLGRLALEAVHPEPGHTVLDLACGTGIVARHAVRAVGTSGRVIGCDVNPAMLEVAREVVPDGVEWLLAPAEAIPLPVETLDAVVCQQGMQFFPDPVAGLREARRLLRHGGRVAATVWSAPDHSPYFDVQAAVVAETAGSGGLTTLEAAMPPDAAPDLATWASDAGLEDVGVREIEAIVDLADLVTFVPAQMAATPWGAAVREEGEQVWATAVEITLDRLDGFRQPHGGASIPFRSWMLTATAG